MSALDNLNAKYVEIMEAVDTLQIYYGKVSAELGSKTQSREKIEKALQHMKKMISEIRCDDYAQIIDTIAIVEKYILCIDSIHEYGRILLSHKKAEHAVVMKAVDNISKCQSDFDKLMVEFNCKYSYLMNSEDAICSAMAACIGNVVSTIQEEADSVKKEARDIVSKNFQ